MQKWIKNGLLLALLCVLPGGMADAEEIQQIGQGHFTGTISHDLEGNIVLDFTDIQLTLPSGWSGKCAIKAVSYTHLQQFKRSCLPDGPKVGSVAVSPRGDLRMPSDGCARIWLDNLDTIQV